MATEDEELRLTVSLVDNASAGLQRLRAQLEDTGAGKASDATARMRREVEETHRSLKPWQEDMARTAEGILPEWTRGIIGGGTALLGFGYAIKETADKLKEFSVQMNNWNAIAIQTGQN